MGFYRAWSELEYYSIDQKRMKVSIITITYNAEKTLEQTIKSVINQTYKNIEYIVIDGGSKDSSLNIIKKYENNISKWISEPDEGISDAFNKGIDLATGELVGILNADDWYEPTTVQTVVENFNETYDIYCADLNLVDEQDKPFKRMKSKVWFIDYGMHIMHPTTFVTLKSYKKYGKFDKELKIAMDYDLFLRLKANGCKFQYIRQIFTNMRIEGASSDIRKTYKEELFVKKRYLSGMKYLLAFFHNKINMYRILLNKRIYGR